MREGYHGPHENSDEEDLSKIDLENGQEFDVEELKDATYRALIPPMDKDELFEIKAKVCLSLLINAPALTDSRTSNPCVHMKLSLQHTFPCHS